MDKNTTTGLFLIGILLVGAIYFGQPSDKERQYQAAQDSIAALQTNAESDKVTAAAAPSTEMQPAAQVDSSSIFFAHRNGQAQDITIGNGKVEVMLSTKGAQMKGARIKGYKSHLTGQDVVVMGSDDSHLSFSFAGKQENIDTDQYYFDVVSKTDTSVTMAVGDAGRTLSITYSLMQDSYAMEVQVGTNGMSGFFDPSLREMHIDWADHIAQQEKGYDFENRYSTLTYKRRDGGTKSLGATGDEEKTPEEALEWIAFKNQFFSAVLIAGDECFTKSDLSSRQEKEPKNGFLKTYEARMCAPFDPTGAERTTMKMYLGPNDFHALQQHNDILATNGRDICMEELVDLGWPIVRWINRWFIIYLFDWLSAFGLNMGIVLLLLTIIVKVLVFPTNKKSYLSSVKMRVLKPQIDALSAKYPKQEDALKKQQEMMQIYSSYGVSPMGGCLPMLIQMPIWIALFNFVPNAIELRGQSFLWADDLSAYDDIIRWDADIWLLGDHLSIFCILFCLTNIINTWISMKQQQNQMSGEQAQQMKMMQYMMYVMPVMFFFMFNNYSSGLCYYYFLSGLTSIIIMWYLRKTTDEKKVLAKLEAYRQLHKNDAKKTSNMAARLEALQKMQQQSRSNQR